MNIEKEIEYSFNLDESLLTEYKCTKQVLEWLKENMESLTDDTARKIFSKVNYGYNENTIKGFGKKPVCDVYIDNLDYSTDFTENKPSIVNSFIIYHFKGNMNNIYLKSCELTDYIIQKFNENSSFRELPYIVKDTRIEDITFEILPGAKSYGVLVAFQLKHELY